MNYLQKLRELNDKSTPGPWVSIGISGAAPRNNPENSFDRGHADAELIAAMRNALPLFLELAREVDDIVGGLLPRDLQNSLSRRDERVMVEFRKDDPLVKALAKLKGGV